MKIIVMFLFLGLIVYEISNVFLTKNIKTVSSSKMNIYNSIKYIEEKPEIQNTKKSSQEDKRNLIDVSNDGYEMCKESDNFDDCYDNESTQISESSLFFASSVLPPDISGTKWEDHLKMMNEIYSYEEPYDFNELIKMSTKMKDEDVIMNYYDNYLEEI